MDEFGAEREAARRGIEAAGAEPVLADDFPSLAVSSRTACLDAVASCDACLVIIGNRGGWTAPSGRLVVEEEYDEARRRSLPVLVLVGDVERDGDAERLARRLSDYVDGHFRRTYSKPKDIEALASDAVRAVAAELEMPVNDPVAIQSRVEQRPSDRQGARVRVVLAPERRDQLISPLKLGDDATVNRLYSIGHQPEISLFDYEGSMSRTIDRETDELRIAQASSRRMRSEDVVARITPAGLIDLETRVKRDSDGLSSPEAHVAATLVILEGDVRQALEASLGFARATYDELDPYGRFGRLRINVALVGHGSRPLVPVPPAGGAVTMNMSGRDPVVAFVEPQRTTRQALGDPSGLVSEVIGLFARRLGSA